MDSDNLDISPARTSFRTRVLVMGGAIGTALGILSALLYIRASEQLHGDEVPPPPRSRDAMKLAMTLIGMIRSITEWAKR